MNGIQFHDVRPGQDVAADEFLAWAMGQFDALAAAQRAELEAEIAHFGRQVKRRIRKGYEAAVRERRATAPAIVRRMFYEFDDVADARDAVLDILGADD